MTIETKSEPNRTPRANRALPHRLGGFGTIAEGLDYAARGETGFNFYSGRGALDLVLPFAELKSRAEATARRLIGSGLPRGSRVAVVAETAPAFMEVFFGCQYAGLIPCPMPYSMYIGGKDAYVSRIAGMLLSADAQLAIAPEALMPHIREAAERAGGIRAMSHDELGALAPDPQPLMPFGPDDAAYIQYSSGSTSEPKGVLIAQAAIMANTTGILRQGLGVTQQDRAFSWLPLYHDMGLVGLCIAPLMGQVSVDYLPTPAFARRPALWLQLMSENRSTIAYSPSFGYDLAARRINGQAATLDLRHWRAAGIGGDMVRADVLDQFAAKLSVAGFRSVAFLPSYGMAEATLAITLCDPDTPLRIDTVERAQVKLARRAVPASTRIAQNPDKVRSFVVCGRPLEGHRIEIRDETGRALGQRQIGRVFFAGPSLMSRYFQNPQATSESLGDDRFLDTGDMGYWLGDEIVITGRAKDLILHNGRNIWPQDIEWAAERIEPLRSGDVAAFAVEGSGGDDEVVVLAECRLADSASMEDLRRKVAAAVHQSAGVECDIVLVAPKSLPFTSSGKLSRAGAKARYLAGEIAEIAPPRLAPEPRRGLLREVAG